jgi:hypothetical protein
MRRHREALDAVAAAWRGLLEKCSRIRSAAGLTLPDQKKGKVRHDIDDEQP